jgi:hypothetical protein
VIIVILVGSAEATTIDTNATTTDKKSFFIFVNFYSPTFIKFFIFGEVFAFLFFYCCYVQPPQAVKKANFCRSQVLRPTSPALCRRCGLLKIMYLCHTPPFYFWEGCGAGVVTS